MMNEVEKLLENIKTDYLEWTKACRGGSSESGELSDINLRMIDDFNNGVRFSEGNKYIKILTSTSVWGFIVNVDNDKKFKKGDILMAAGYNAPARNKARGNLFEGYEIRWTGPHYLN